MPLLFSAFLALGAGSWWSWRLAMVNPGMAMLLAGIAYFYLTQDTPDGDPSNNTASGGRDARRRASAAFREVCADRRVGLGILYAGCFGMELTIDNIAALYFVDTFQLSLGSAGLVAGTFDLMNLFARALGGIVSDHCHTRWGLRGRSALLPVTIAFEGVALACFSQARWLPAAIACMLLTGLFIKMANGATYTIVPFINKRTLGAVLAGFLFKTSSLTWPQALLILAGIVGASALLALAVRFSNLDEHTAREEMRVRMRPVLEVSPAAGD